MYTRNMFLFSLSLISATFATPVEGDGNPLHVRAAGTACTTSLPNPEPSGLRCGVRGYLNNPSVTAQSSVKHLNDCRNACFLNNQCVSFSFEFARDACILYNENLNQQGFVASKAKTVFYNRHCYVVSCPTTTSTSTSSSTTSSSSSSPTNYIVNGGFETGTFYEWSAGDSAGNMPGDAAAASVVSPGYQSSYAASLYAATGPAEQSTSSASIEQFNIGTPPGEVSISFNYMSLLNSTGSGLVLNYYFLVSDGGTLCDGGISFDPPNADSNGVAPGEWGYFSSYCPADGNTISLLLVLGQEVGSNQTVLIDNVAVVDGF